jgi:hypothetical protein
MSPRFGLPADGIWSRRLPLRPQGEEAGKHLLLENQRTCYGSGRRVGSDAPVFVRPKGEEQEKTLNRWSAQAAENAQNRKGDQRKSKLFPLLDLARYGLGFDRFG